MPPWPHVSFMGEPPPLHSAGLMWQGNSAWPIGLGIPPLSLFTFAVAQWQRVGGGGVLACSWRGRPKAGRPLARQPSHFMRKCHNVGIDLSAVRVTRGRGAHPTSLHLCATWSSPLSDRTTVCSLVEQAGRPHQPMLPSPANRWAMPPMLHGPPHKGRMTKEPGLPCLSPAHSGKAEPSPAQQQLQNQSSTPPAQATLAP